MQGILKSLGQSWRDSLRLFIPSNFKIFILVTLNAIKQGIIPWLRHGLLPMVIMLFGFHGISLIVHIVGNSTLINAFVTALPIFILIVAAYLSFTLCLALRPSVARKNGAYFRSYWPHFVWAVIGILICGSLFLLFMSPALTDVKCVHYVITPVLVFFTLFFVEMRPSLKGFLKAIRNASLMTFYNLPFIAVSVGIACVFHAVNVYIDNGLGDIKLLMSPWVLLYGAGIGLLFIVNCIMYFVGKAYWVNFYIKRLHEQFKLYGGDGY
jgi:hypothetical protein